MSHLLRSRAIAVFALFPLFALGACKGDEEGYVTAVREERARLARQFDDLAAEAGQEEENFHLAESLEAAADAIRAGSGIGELDVRTDGTSASYRAFAYETAIGPAACEQLRAALPEEVSNPCRAQHGLIAWQQTGERVTRVLFVGADSGASRFELDPDGFPDDDQNLGSYTYALGQQFERGSRVVRVTAEGTLAQERTFLGQPCQSTPETEPGMEIQCSLAVFRHSYDMTLLVWDLADPFNTGPHAPPELRQTSRVQIAAQGIPGLRITIVRFGPNGPGRR